MSCGLGWVGVGVGVGVALGWVESSAKVNEQGGVELELSSVGCVHWVGE